MPPRTNHATDRVMFDLPRALSFLACTTAVPHCFFPRLNQSLETEPKIIKMKVDVSEVFASAFLFAAGTPKGLDAKVSLILNYFFL